jgi:hypothetical protein
MVTWHCVLEPGGYQTLYLWWNWDAWYKLHEVVPRPCKICDWLLNSSWDHIGLYQGKKTQSDYWVRTLQKTNLRPTLYNDMVQLMGGFLCAFDSLWRHIDVSEPVASEVNSLLIMTSYDLSNVHEWYVCVFLWLVCMVIQVNARACAEARFGVWSLYGHLYVSGVCTRVDGSIFANLSNFA